MNPPFKGQNQRELLAMLRTLGGSVEQIPSTGEIACSHPRSLRRLRINLRKKSGVPALYLLVKDAYLARRTDEEGTERVAAVAQGLEVERGRES